MKKNHSAEQIVAVLRKIESAQAQGKTIALACKEAGISEWTYYRWRKQYGGMNKDEAKRLKELEKENARLKRLLAEKELDNSILKEALEGRY